MLGRRVELAALRRMLDELAGGRGRCVLIEGEPGSGKTALLDTLLDAAGAAGAGFTVRASSGATASDDALSVLLQALGAAEPEAAEPIERVVEHVFALVDRLCAAGPLVLAVDDLHAADEASLLVWQRLCAVAHRSALLLVGALRPVPRRVAIDRLRRVLKDNGGGSVVLERLAPEDVADLAARLLGAVPGPRLVDRLESAGGNPRYIHELLDALIRAQSIEIRDGKAELADAATPGPGPVDALATAIADRLGFLGAATVETLRTAALLGPEFAVTDLSAALSRPAGALAAGVQDAVAAGVLEPIGRQLRFRHGLLRQALHESIPGPERAALRQAAIRALMANAAPVERVAELIVTDLDAADGWETRWTTRHAEPIARRAPEIAADLFDHVLGHPDITAPQRIALLEGFAALSFTLYGLGRHAAARTAAARIESDPELPEVWRARLAARAASTPPEVEAALAEGVRLADVMTIGYAMHAEAASRLRAADPTGCIEAADRALSIIGPSPRLPDLRLALTDRRASAVAELAYHQGRWDEARAEIDTLQDLSGAHGLAALIALRRDAEPTAALHLRELTDEDAYATLARAAYAERANRPGEALAALSADQRALALPLLVRLALDAGDDRLARSAAAHAHDAVRQWCEGLIAADPDQLSVAAESLRAEARTPELGQVLEDLAVLHAREGRESEARAASTEALAVYVQLGAAWDARRTATRLRAHGVRTNVRTRRRPSSGTDALTRAELRVARLAGQGKSNPDIAAELSLSPRTVESHVSRILMKLGVSSRREIAQALGRD